MATIMIAEYLDEEEASGLRERLLADGIEPIVKRHGLPRMFGVDATYRVFIERSAAEKGRFIVERFLTECSEKRAEVRKKMSTLCPRCQSENIINREKRTPWMKLRFFGVSVWRCSDCGHRWYI